MATVTDNATTEVIWYDGANGPYAADVPTEQVDEFRRSHGVDDPYEAQEDKGDPDEPDDRKPSDADAQTPTPADVAKLHTDNTPYKGQSLS